MGLYDSDLLAIQEARSLARSAKKAQEIFSSFDAEQIDKILKNMVKAAVENSERLAEMAVEETGFGKVKDKILKNRLASVDLYDYIKDMKTVGIICEDKVKKVTEIAEPVGVILGIIPSTNPTSTAIYKSIISLKSRNAIIFSSHPSARKCTFEAARLMHDAAIEAGAPEGIIGCVSMPSMQATNELMHAQEVSMIIATGGSALVKSAYSAGKPALGVGPGNVPAYIERSADIKKAVKNIVVSKTFDNSTICASEQAIITEECIKDEVISELKRNGCYFMNSEEIKLLNKNLFKPGFAMNAQLMGKSACDIAKKIGIKVPEGTTILIGSQEGVGKDYPLSYEKLTCVLAFYTVKDWKESCELCMKLLNNGGVGHSLSLHTEDKNIVNKFAAKPVFRILVNCPSSLGGTGVVTGLAPAFTLGCGTWGGSATSDNITPMHLINIKRIAYSIKDADDVLGDVKCCSEKVSDCDLEPEDMELIIKKVLKALKESDR
jgi:acetaldehyde dehydrogenase (acetylating)